MRLPSDARTALVATLAGAEQIVAALVQRNPRLQVSSMGPQLERLRAMLPALEHRVL